MKKFLVVMPLVVIILTATIKISEAMTLVEPLPEIVTETTAPEITNIIVITSETDPVEVVETEAAPTYTEEDLYYLTQILVGECQSYSWEHQVAVGSVVLNRVNHPAYPNTIREVIEQRGQYSCLHDGNFYRTATDTNIAVAKFLLENGSQLPGNCVYQAQFKQGSGVYQKIGNTYICYR